MKWILIDGPWLAYRARYSVGLDGMLADDPGLLAFGMLDMLRSLCLDPRIQSNNVKFFFDSTRSFRRDQFPAYKSNRAKHSLEEFKDQELFRVALADFMGNVLPQLDIPVYQEYGYEADDLIASAASNVGCGRGAVIVSADGDLWQCITRDVDWYNATTRNYVTMGRFRDIKGVWPDQWAAVKAMAGCTSDAIPGIRGIGEMTAIQYLKEKISITTSRFKKINGPEGQQTIRDTMELVKLPLAGCPDICLTEPTVWSAWGFKEICDQYGFSEFQEGTRRSAWHKVMRGSISLEQIQRTRTRRRTHG